jgi:hypothetical protein
MTVLFGLAIEAVIVIMVALGIGQIADHADHKTTQSQKAQ